MKQKKQTYEWKLKDILMVGIAGVLFAVLYLGMVYLGTALTTFLTPFGLGVLGYEPIYGVWFMAATFTTYVIQKPGVGVIAEMLAALLEVLMGNMFGPIIFISGFIQGFGSELGFAAFRYRRFDMRSMALASVGCTLLSFIWTGIRSQYWTLSLWLVLLILVIRLVSSFLFCALGSKILADGLARSGVLRGYALGQNVINFDAADAR